MYLGDFKESLQDDKRRSLVNKFALTSRESKLIISYRQGL